MSKKIKIEEEQEQIEANGHDDSLLQGIANSLALLTDRLDEMEERIQNNSATNQALLQMVNLFYDTADKHITELSYISPLTSRPFAEALTMDALLDEDVKSGAISLNKKLILNYLRLQRSVRGRHFALGLPVLEQQVTAQTEKNADEFEGGSE